MTATNPTARPRASLLILGLRASVAVLALSTTVVLHIRLRACTRAPLILVHLTLTVGHQRNIND